MRGVHGAQRAWIKGREAGAGAETVLAALALAAAVNHAARADEPVQVLPETVVSASRVAIPAETAGSAVTVITAQDLHRRQTRLVSDVLREVPGLSVSRAGNVGSLTQVRIRGAEANQTLVLIDGIEVGDPAFSEFDFANLPAADIERIEIIRGPQSALWGSDAIGGVIDITTKRGRAGVEANASAEAGSFATRHGNASLRGGTERWNLALSGTYLQTNGIDVARAGDEQDGYDNVTFFATGGARLLEDRGVADALDLEVAGRFVKARVETDPQDFAVPPTPTQGLAIDGDDSTDTEQRFGRVRSTLVTFGGVWEHAAGAAVTDTDSDFSSDGTRTSGSQGRRVKLDYQTNLRFATPGIGEAAHTLIFLAEREEETFEQEGPSPTSPQNQRRNRHVNGFVGEYRLDLWGRLFLSGAVRHDDNEDFADATTYRATAAYVHPGTDTRVHGSYGTGATNPTFLEQFGFFPGSFAGNPDLEPEKSEGWDAGFEQPFLDGRVVLDVTYFRADLEDEIVSTFDPATFLTSVDNLEGRSEREGVEISLSAKILDGLSIAAAYTYTNAEDADGRKEVRRPRHVASLDVNRRFLGDRANVNLSLRYTGQQDDIEFIAATPEDRVVLDDYALVNLSGAYRITERVTAFARIENLLDQNYEEVFGFRSPGIAGFAGIRITLGR